MAGQTSTMDRNDGTSWMSRSQEVLAHLRVAADELDYVTVEAAGEKGFATLGVLPGQESVFTLQLDGGSTLPGASPGMVMKVTYNKGSASFEFLSVVVDRGEYGKLMVGMPRVIERRERRAARRLNVSSGGRVRLDTDWGAQLVVFDISTSGIAVLATNRDTRRALADGVRGVLTLTADIRINVWLDVRHTRPMKDSTMTLIGAQFLGLPSRDLALIRNFIDARLNEG